jgi:restriction system protein
LKNFTIKQAAIKVLKDEGKPLTVKEIYSKILEKDYYRFKAQDPLHIVQVEIRRHCKGVVFPTAHPNKDFQILKDGKYWLLDEPIENEFEFLISEQKENYSAISNELQSLHLRYVKQFKLSILKQLKNIEPGTFEIFSKKLLEIYGFKNLEVTRITKDGGIDGHGKLKVGISFLNVAFQCKRWSFNSVGRQEIDKFRGAIQGEYEQGIFFTTSKFLKEALGASSKKGAVPIVLIDGSSLVDIMIEKKFGIGVENLPIYINELDEVLN